MRRATVGHGRKASRASLAGWASGLGLVCIVAGFTFATRAHELPLSAVRRERDEDRVRSGVGGSGERPHRRPAGSDRSSGVRRARRGDAAILRSADVLARRSTGPCGLDAAGVRDHRLDAARGSAHVHERGRDAGFRRFGDARRLGRRDHRDRVESGWHRSPSTAPSSPPASARSPESAWWLHPDPSILTTEHLFAFFIGCGIVSWRRLAAAENGGKPSPRSTAPERSPARLSEGRPRRRRSQTSLAGAAPTVSLGVGGGRVLRTESARRT